MSTLSREKWLDDLNEGDTVLVKQYHSYMIDEVYTSEKSFYMVDEVYTSEKFFYVAMEIEALYQEDILVHQELLNFHQRVRYDSIYQEGQVDQESGKEVSDQTKECAEFLKLKDMSHKIYGLQDHLIVCYDHPNLKEIYKQAMLLKSLMDNKNVNQKEEQ